MENKLPKGIKISAEKKKQFKYALNAFLIRYFKWLIILLAAAIVAGGYFFLIQPKYKKLKEEIKSFSEDKRNEYYDRQKYLNKLKELKAAYKQAKPEDMNKMKVILPEKEGKEELMSQLEAVVLKNGLLLSSLQLEKEKEEAKDRPAIEMAKAEKGGEEALPKEIGRIKIEMEIMGTDYRGFKNILYTLENNLRLIDITKVGFAPEEGKTAIQAFTYYLKSSNVSN